MFTCHNGTEHQHSSVLESKVCYGLVTLPVVTAPIKPYTHLERKDQPGSITPRQMSYLKALGATDAHLFDIHGNGLSINQASRLIDDFKRGRASVSMPEYSEPQPVAVKVEDKRLTMVKAMFDMVPDGYFAMQADSNEKLVFLRVSTPKSGTYKGTRKIQTQHGPRLELAAAIWPSTKWSFYNSSIVDSLLLLVSDYQGCALKYAREIGKCCRCNAPLTDEHSRWYGIGPECVTYWPWMIDRVDAEFGVFLR